jgi:cyclophilin family peptidyl-prolyl cis-trans isomerase
MIPTVTRRTRRPVAAAVLVAAFLVAACSGGGATPTPVPTDTPDAFGTCPTAQPDPLPAGETRTVTIQTGLGEIAIALEADLSPIAVGNFAALAECGYYDGVVFHRVVPGFVIQGGDGQYGKKPSLDADRVGTGGPGYRIQDEPVTATYSRGVVAMARTSAPDSVGSQFFIVLSDDARGSLQSANTYQILGRVSAGMETADAIAAAADAEIPSDPVEMTDVSVATP